MLRKRTLLLFLLAFVLRLLLQGWDSGITSSSHPDERQVGFVTERAEGWFDDPDFYAYRERSLDETFPWEVVSTGVRMGFLLKEYQHSQRGETLVDCREQCYGCGILAAFGDAWSEEWRCPSPKKPGF